MDDAAGRPRCDGLRSLLEARRIDRPWGDPRDAPAALMACGLGSCKEELFVEVMRREGVTVCCLGSRKEEVFAEVMRREGVELFEGILALLRALPAKGRGPGPSRPADGDARPCRRDQGRPRAAVTEAGIEDAGRS